MPSSGGRISLRGLLSLALLLHFGSTGISYAQTASVPEKQCGDYGTQSEMNECAAKEAQKADAALNSTYQKLIGKLKGDKTATARVVAAEKAWITFRDAELAADWPVADGENPNLQYGSVHPFCYYNERAAMTLERLKTLSNRMRHEEEGDVCTTAIASQQGQHAPTLSCGSAASDKKLPVKAKMARLCAHRNSGPRISGE